jgi:hypothetical protein
MRWSLALLALTGSMLFACRRGPPPRITLADVERCERGIDLSATQPTFEQASATFYRECSSTVAEPECRQAFVEASLAKPDRQVPIVLERCSKVYCPIFSGRNLAVCGSTFQASPLAAAFGWAELHGAILERDASGYAPRLKRAFMAKDLELVKKAPPSNTPAAPATAATTSAPPPGDAPDAEAPAADASPCAGSADR